jgi:hypothetical protein
MKWFLILLAAPVGSLIAWYGLSYHDISFGFFMLTRETHDLVFQLYGNVLGIEPETIPPLVARALVVDTFIVLGIVAFRKRCEIRAWWAARHAHNAALQSDESLSSAP